MLTKRKLTKQYTSLMLAPHSLILTDLKTYSEQQVWPLLATAMGSPSQPSLAALWVQYQASDYVLAGYWFDNQLIALAGLNKPNAQVGAAELLHLAVLKTFQGRGLGRALLADLIQTFKLWRLDAETDLESLGFYQRCGWASLALKPRPDKPVSRQRYGVYWLDPEHVLADSFCFSPPPIQAVYLPDVPKANVQILRLDLLHPLLSGNKWFKLRRNLIAARQQGFQRILTLGGAWSNHLLATAAAGRLLGFQTVGLVRGEIPERLDKLSPILRFAQDCGMKLVPVSRSDYREHCNQPSRLRQLYPEAWVIPEGGANLLGVTGSADILAYLPADTCQLALAMGTGTTLAGLLSQAPAELKLLGVAVLKGGDFLRQEVSNWLNQLQVVEPEWELETAYHAGGYARNNPELRDFLQRFSVLNPDLPVEPVYTGKLLWAINQRLMFNQRSTFKQQLSQQNPLLLLHTGGVTLPDYSCLDQGVR